MNKYSDKLVFTICSINYLAQALTLGHSLEKTNPGVAFRIYLVDSLFGRENIKEKIPFTLIEIQDVPIFDFDEMCLRYNQIELNTSVKPFIFDYILKSEPLINQILYLDPDIMVFHPLDDLFLKLGKYNIILTPHILTPSNACPHVPSERSFLGTGIFNLGFICLRRSNTVECFLAWWKDRMVDQGYCKEEEQLFFDQKWINYVPAFFDGVHIEKGRGYNMASWNLHERIIREIDSKYVVNDIEPLVFYHFSGYSISTPEKISRHTTFTFELRPDLKNIVSNYHHNLLTNNEYFFKTFSYYFGQYKRDIMRINALKGSSPFMKILRRVKYKLQTYKIARHNSFVNNINI